MNSLTLDFTKFVQIHNAQPITTSEFVAQAFQKNHAHVLRKIDDLLADIPVDVEIRKSFTFAEKESKVGFGTRKDRFCELTKDGFMLLVMGFTGKAAMQIKIAYLQSASIGFFY